MLISIATVGLYTAWTATTIYDRYQKDLKNSFTSSIVKPAIAIEVLFNLYMLYLLINMSRGFLVITLLTLMLHVGAGLYAEIFKPQSRIDNREMTKYWSLLGIDVALSLSAYFIVTSFGF